MTDEPIENDVSMLKKARTEKGYSLSMVHEATNIPLDVLRAVEEGYKVRSLSPFYYKAFIKTYAKYLEIDGDNAVTQFMAREDELGMKLTKYEPKKEFRPPKSQLDHKVEEYWTPKMKKQVTKFIVGAVIVLVAIKIVWMIGAWIVGGIQSWQSQPKSVKAPTTQEEVKKKKVVPVAQVKESATKTTKKIDVRTPAPTQSPVAKVNQETPKRIVISKSVMVTVRATKDAFLIVESDGKNVFQSKMRKGSVETWSAAKEIIISGKELGALEYEVNGDLIGKLSRGDSKAKRITVTQKGLSIKK